MTASLLFNCDKDKTTTSVKNTKQENKTEVIETNKPTKTPTEKPKKEEEKKKITDEDIRKAGEIIKKNSIAKYSSDEETVENFFNFSSNIKESKIMYKIVEFILNDGFDVNKLTFEMYEDEEHFTF